MLLGIVLAGGLSSRMGADKALMRFAGQQQLQRSCQLLLDAGADKVLVSRNQAGFIADCRPALGPLAGVEACLLAQPCAEALIVPVDMPLLTGFSLAQLLAFGREQAQSCYFDSSVLPCYLRSPLQALQQAQQRLDQGQRSVAGWLSALSAKPLCNSVTQHHPELLFNTNTPEQWQQAQLLLRQQESLWVI